MSSDSKRKVSDADASRCKKQKPSGHDTPVRRDLLQRCYATVTTLRGHVLLHLPGSSRLRRKKIASLGTSESISETEAQLVQLLDTTLVCSHQQDHHVQDTRWEQWVSFSQKGDESYVTISNGLAGSLYSQSEIVDFVIWSLFSKELKSGRRPKHLLCDGFRKVTGPTDKGATSIPNIFSLYPNSHVKALREAPWPQLLALLGQSGERMMIDLLLDSSIYIPLQAGFYNYYQICGIPLSELDLSGNASSLRKDGLPQCRKPAEITLVRSRIFYAKPSLTSRGLVQSGFKHIHVLNRCLHLSKPDKEVRIADSESQAEQRGNTIKVMMYMFPRQFRLHNVFTSQVDHSQTAQRFQDYTLREEEIALAFPPKPDAPTAQLAKVPKRLRGEAGALVERLRILHGRCSYVELLGHYCPCMFDIPSRSRRPGLKRESGKHRNSQGVKATLSQGRRSLKKKHLRKQAPSTQMLPQPQIQYKSLVEIATPKAQVSAFCQAVLSKIIPDQFWGEGETQAHNKEAALKKVDHFIQLRRFESVSLHEIMQDLKITDISWLQPPGLRDQKPSKTDAAKRHEIFHEFLYYVFDSLLIPLIRSHFYVTESNTHRYQVFYFRHEVWKYVAEPSMAKLKENMLDEVKLDDALRILQSRPLGFSQVRLLPKGDKLRPIMNLRRRALARGPTKKLGPSINTILGPVHTLLKLERTLHPSKLGSTMFSVSDIYTRLKAFKQNLEPNHTRFYFAKVDVTAAFDTIPQAAVVQLMGSVPSQAEYVVTKHAEVKPGDRDALPGDKAASKPIRRWHAQALAEGNKNRFRERLEKGLAGKKKNTVFVESAMRKTHSVHDLMDLLAQHVEQNLVKVGKKYYRQKTGIPQGSVLSSFLCNYFYADLERKHLGFLDGPDTLLLRLIDDFLLITLDRDKAVQFVEKMHGGLPDYGVVVNPKKTLINFDMWCRSGEVYKTDQGMGFPYCGTLINTQTLDIAKDREKNVDVDISASLTVDHGRAPGQNFQRKVLNAFKIQSHLMFFDTTHNSTRTVLQSLHGAFCETATKMWAYIRCLAKARQPSSNIIIRTISKLVDVAFLLLTGKSRTMRYPQYTCEVRKSQVAAIACLAFSKVLTKRQTKYGQVIAWLDRQAEKIGAGQAY